MGNITSAIPSMKDLLAEEAYKADDGNDTDEGGITSAVPRLTDLLQEEEEEEVMLFFCICHFLISVYTHQRQHHDGMLFGK